VTKIIVTALAGLALAISACASTDSSSSDSGSTTAQAEAKPRSKRTPLACLEKAELMEPEKRDTNLWRGTDPIDGTAVIVERRGSVSAAREQAAQARLVFARSKGRYVVHGALKSAKGRWHHEANVDNVADCLRGAS
jgi:hypothetical protein